MNNEKKEFEKYLEQNYEQLVLLSKSTERILSITEASAADFKNFKKHSFFPSVTQMDRINNRLIKVEIQSKKNDFKKTVEYTIIKWCVIIIFVILFFIIVTIV